MEAAEMTLEELEALSWRKMVIRRRLDALSKDIVQALAGELVPDLEDRKAEFIRLHNALRELEGKEPREIAEEGEK